MDRSRGYKTGGGFTYQKRGQVHLRRKPGREAKGVTDVIRKSPITLASSAVKFGSASQLSSRF